MHQTKKGKQWYFDEGAIGVRVWRRFDGGQRQRVTQASAASLRRWGDALPGSGEASRAPGLDRGDSARPAEGVAEEAAARRRCGRIRLSCVGYAKVPEQAAHRVALGFTNLLSPAATRETCPPLAGRSGSDADIARSLVSRAKQPPACRQYRRASHAGLSPSKPRTSVVRLSALACSAMNGPRHAR